jgi:excinuclease UvrABC nuclease subunit
MKLSWSKLIPLDESFIALQPAKPGVYRLSYKSADGFYYVFYVGNTDSLKESLSNHISEVEENECIKTTIKNLECYFKATEISDTKDRIDAVRTMIEYYKPKCNPPQTAGSVVELNFN